jgi:gliding motility-associated-like protein
VSPSSLGWDGTLNGEPLPADDYWFTLKLEDGREAKGHFSLKR